MPDARWVVSRRRSARRWALPLLAVLVAVLPAGLLLAGCAEEGPRPASHQPDASVPQCTPGTRACICTDTGGCAPGLLCNSGRCFDTEGTGPDTDPDVRPARPPVKLPELSPPDASTDADSGPTSNG
jgi:hypothetical protein